MEGVHTGRATEILQGQFMPLTRLLQEAPAVVAIVVTVRFYQAGLIDGEGCLTTTLGGALEAVDLESNQSQKTDISRLLQAQNVATLERVRGGSRYNFHPDSDILALVAPPPSPADSASNTPSRTDRTLALVRQRQRVLSLQNDAHQIIAGIIEQYGDDWVLAAQVLLRALLDKEEGSLEPLLNEILQLLNKLASELRKS